MRGYPRRCAALIFCCLKATFPAEVLRMGSRPLPASAARLESGVLGALSEGERVIGSGVPWLLGHGSSEASVLLDAMDRLILEVDSGLPRSRRSAGPVRGGKAIGASDGEPAGQGLGGYCLGYHTGEVVHEWILSGPDSFFNGVH